MHIRENEATDELDYEFFFRSDKDSDDSGRKIWRVYHGLAENHPCPVCRPHAVKGMTGFHDMTSIKVHDDKAVWDPGNFEEFVKNVNSAYMDWVKAGKPIRKDSPHSKECDGKTYCVPHKVE